MTWTFQGQALLGYKPCWVRNPMPARPSVLCDNCSPFAVQLEEYGGENGILCVQVYVHGAPGFKAVCFVEACLTCFVCVSYTCMYIHDKSHAQSWQSSCLPDLCCKDRLSAHRHARPFALPLAVRTEFGRSAVGSTTGLRPGLPTTL